MVLVLKYDGSTMVLPLYLNITMVLHLYHAKIWIITITIITII
jgi:hypothetical protein